MSEAGRGRCMHRSKSTACLVEDSLSKSTLTRDSFSSQPEQLNSLCDLKTNHDRRKHGRSHASPPHRNQSLSRFFRWRSKHHDEDCITSQSRQESTALDRTYSKSSTIIEEGGSFTSLLDLNPSAQHFVKGADSRHNIASKSEVEGGLDTLRLHKEQSSSKSLRLSPSPMASTISGLNDTTTVPEPTPRQGRGHGLRHHLFTRSHQRLDDSAGKQAEHQEIEIKAIGFEVGMLQPSLLGSRKHCFYVKATTGNIHVFAAASQEERCCWLTR
ncbi:unnamed protein product [Mesocestoides corti]|uniref:PH domain-containing protein n=1 Tax=Mesocestoides corti TaxID=53468 RepID=A0A158QUH4_MESCO|nr:unnamed protein product [Mesocestoides corti]